MGILTSPTGVASEDVLAPDTRSDTEKGKAFVLHRLREIPRVRVEVFGGRSLLDQSIQVFVPHRDFETEYAVYDVLDEALTRFPEARLGLDVLLEVNSSSAP